MTLCRRNKSRWRKQQAVIVLTKGNKSRNAEKQKKSICLGSRTDPENLRNKQKSTNGNVNGNVKMLKTP